MPRDRGELWAQRIAQGARVPERLRESLENELNVNLPPGEERAALLEHVGVDDTVSPAELARRVRVKREGTSETAGPVIERSRPTRPEPAHADHATPTRPDKPVEPGRKK